MRIFAIPVLMVGLVAAAALAGCGDRGSQAEAPSAPSSPPVPALAASRAADRYGDYVRTQVAELARRTDAFAASVRAGDVEAAKATFASTREPWERVEPVAASFGDLDPALDAREGDGPDAEWTGFHRIEKGLWADGSAEGLGPVADRLRADVGRLSALVADQRLDPPTIATGAKELLDEVAGSKITGEEDRYSHTDLWDFRANVEGSRAAFDALSPTVEARDPALARTIAERFAAVERSLDPYRRGEGFVAYTDLGDGDTKALARAVDDLAEPLSRVAAVVGG